MAKYWKKGKAHWRNGKLKRWIYPNGKKSGKKLVNVRRGGSYRRRRW
jgi:hypothetical protein